MKTQKITACAFLYKNNKLLIAKRADTKKFLPGKFELPGGHLEYGESLQDGLKREFQEEFKVDINVHEPFYAFTYINKTKKAHVVEIVFFATLKNKKQVITLDPKVHSALAWISKDKIDEYYDDKDKEKQAVKKGFEILDSKN